MKTNPVLESTEQIINRLAAEPCRCSCRRDAHAWIVVAGVNMRGGCRAHPTCTAFHPILNLPGVVAYGPPSDSHVRTYWRAQSGQLRQPGRFLLYFDRMRVLDAFEALLDSYAREQGKQGDPL